ncbi:MAG: hypothetical protein J0H15_04240 [Xanthomonadales bacterium]|nr:hypothetical protein [Xanthomonadales bacterium]
MADELPAPALSQRAAPAARTGWLDSVDRLELASDRLPWQRSLRWQAPPRPRRWVVPGLLLAVLTTVVELAGFASGMRSWHHATTTPSEPVQVVLIDEMPAFPIPPEPEPPPFVARPSRIVVTPPETRPAPPPPRAAEEDSSAMRARMGSAGAASGKPRLFNPDGSVRIDPAATAAPARPRTERDQAIARWAEIEDRGNPLDCQKTRFADAFSRDESVGDEVARKYLKWIGLADPGGIESRHRARAQSGGCEPAR